MKDICEEYSSCNYDQKSFRAYLARWMSASTQMAPFTSNQTNTLLLASAKAAMAQCVGGASGNLCGQKWYNNGVWDGTDGPGQQMAALEVILGTLTHQTQAPLTNSTGGTSPSVPTAGYNASDVPPGSVVTPANKSDKAGAWAVTAILSVLALWTWAFMSTDMFEDGRSTVAGGKRKKSRMSLARDLEKTTSTIVIDLNSKGKGKFSAGDVEPQIATPSPALRPPNGHRRVDSIKPMDSIEESIDITPNRKSVPIYRGGDGAT
jgi:mannan endo-1,6-alpha-mannosidase